MSQREEDRQNYNETIIDPMSSDFAQDGLLSQVINSEELKEILTNFKSLKPEELNHLFESQNNLSSMMGSGDAFLPNGTINQMILTPANESLPVLNNLAQDLKPLKRCCGNVDDGDRSFLPPAFKRGRIQECDSSTYICAESLKTPSPVPSIYDTNAYEVPDQCNREGQMLPFQTVYTHHICESDEPKGLPIRATMRDRYHNRMNFAGKSKRLPVAVANYNSEHYDRYKSNYDVVETGTPRIHAFLVPQEKGRSKNFDYIGGTATEDPNCDYFVYCRGRPTVVPFAVSIENIQAEEAKLKVQVVFGKIKNRVPIRCSNHKEGDNTVWRDQLMISTDPTAQSLSYQEGHGFVIHPVPPRCDVLFLCRNSCRQGVEKDWQLQFTLMDQDDTELAVRTMGLRVCEVPHRDIMKSKVQFEWNASLSPPERPVMKVLACKEGMQVEQLFPRVATDVYPIYVSGYQSYCEIMQYVSSMELRKKHENPAIAHVAEFMRNWNRATPIMRFLQPVCGVEASLLLDKLNRKDVRTLGDLYSKYTPDFFVNMHISSALASQLSALYLNWRNIIEYYEMSVSKEVSKVCADRLEKMILFPGLTVNKLPLMPSKSSNPNPVDVEMKSKETEMEESKKTKVIFKVEKRSQIKDEEPSAFFCDNCKCWSFEKHIVRPCDCILPLHGGYLYKAYELLGSMDGSKVVLMNTNVTSSEVTSGQKFFVSFAFEEANTRKQFTINHTHGTEATSSYV